MDSAKSTDFESSSKVSTGSLRSRDSMAHQATRLNEDSTGRGLWVSVRLLAGIAMGMAGSAWGASIQVYTTDAVNTEECTLADAIKTANASPPSNEGACVKVGGGATKINLEIPGVAPEDLIFQTAGVLPFVINSGVTVTINGIGGTTAATISRDATASINRFFEVYGTLDLANVTLTGGQQLGGGAIAVSSTGHLKLGGCRFLDNSATSVGGAIYSAGTLTIDKCTFDGNSAAHWGGAIVLWHGSTATIFGSTFVDNSANRGGAIYSYSQVGGSLGLENSTFSSNVALKGGAIYQRSGYTLAEMCTFKGNIASDSGSAIWRTGGTLELSRSAVAGTNLCLGSINSLGNNAAEDATCGLNAAGDLVVADLNLSDGLLDHGGLTKVHVPLHDSPLLDQFLCDDSSARDQRDVFNRYPSIPGAFSPTNYGQDLTCDIGAYESICRTGHSYFRGEYQIFTYTGQASTSFHKVLNNGACQADTVGFGGKSRNCSLRFSIYGAYLEFQNIWLLRQSCLDTHFDGGKDCFSNPEGCRDTCAFNAADATDFSDFNGDFVFPTQTLPGSNYTIDVPRCTWGVPQGETQAGFRYVAEFANGEVDYWDPEMEPEAAQPSG